MADAEHLAKLGLRQTAPFAKGDEILLDTHFGKSLRHARVESRILQQRTLQPLFKRTFLR